MALQEDTDDTGDVISINGVATEDPPKDPPVIEDRGDVVVEADADKEVKTDPPASTTATPAAAATPAAGDDTDAGKKEMPGYVPRARLNEVLDTNKDLKAQLAEAQRVAQEALAMTKPAAAAPATPAAPAWDESAKEQEYADALIDGDTKKAAAIRVEINGHIREQATTEAETRVEARQSQSAAKGDLDSAVSEAIEKFPYLNADGGEEALDAIVALRDTRFAQGGITMGNALRYAVGKLADKLAPESDGTPGRVLPTDPGKTDTRPSNALARGAADANLQPPSTQVGAGNRQTAGRVDVAAMDDDQFKNMSKTDKKRLRGD